VTGVLVGELPCDLVQQTFAAECADRLHFETQTIDSFVNELQFHYTCFSLIWKLCVKTAVTNVEHF
jgi:hypothetical protein